MNDVFDEDLMRELGLDPDEIEAVKNPQAAQAKAPAPQPKAAPAPAPKAPPAPKAAQPQAPKPAPQRPAAPARPAPQPPSKLEASFSTDVDLPLDEEPVAAPAPARNAVAQDLSAYGEKMTQGIPVHLSAVIAKKSVALKDVVEMRTGEVIDFKKMPQDPIDLVVNGKLVAKAELVLVDGRIGARIVKLIR